MTQIIGKLLTRLGQEQNAVKFIASRALRLSGLCRFFKVQRNGYQIHFSPSAFATTLWLNPTAYQEEESWFLNLIEPGDNIMDVGANIGTMALAAASKVGSQGHVYAFEPHPKTFGFLYHNIALNGFDRVKAFNLAIGDHLGLIGISSTYSDDQNSVTNSRRSIQIEQTTLDDFQIQYRLAKVDGIKIDVEGYEKFVLLGARKILKRTRFVFIEVNKFACTKIGYPWTDIISLLTNYHFQIYVPSESGLRLFNSMENHPDCFNIVAIRPDLPLNRETQKRKV